MHYVDWCLRVLHTVDDLTRQSVTARTIGVNTQEVEQAIFGAPAAWGSAEQEAVGDALRDLQASGLLRSRNSSYVEPTDAGRSALADPVPGWVLVCSTKLEKDQQELLVVVNRLSPDDQGDAVRVRDISGGDIIAALPWAADIALLKTVTAELERKGLIGAILTMGTVPETVSVHATYKGMVWETRRKFTVQSQRIDQLVAEWETTSVEFKRDIHLDTKDREAEFTKDILGLANTKASGQHLLIIGFDPRTHAYAGPPNAALTQDWIERTLINDTEPMVEVRYEVLDYRDGPVGIIAVTRDPAKLPYRVKRSVGDKKRVSAGQVFVRHGSQTEEPTSAELAALEAEGRRARGEPDEEVAAGDGQPAT